MTREEALYRVKGYLTDIIPTEDYSEVEEIIKTLSAEPCEDCISREKALKCFTWTNSKGDAWTGIKNLPPVTPKQKMGRWEYTGTYDEDGMLECSVCRREVDPSCYHYKFCPMCGAKMEGDADE